MLVVHYNASSRAALVVDVHLTSVQRDGGRLFIDFCPIWRSIGERIKRIKQYMFLSHCVRKMYLHH